MHKHKETIELHSGTNEIERELPFLIELTDPRAIEDFFGCDQVRKKKKLTSFTLLL